MQDETFKPVGKVIEGLMAGIKEPEADEIGRVYEDRDEGFDALDRLRAKHPTMKLVLVDRQYEQGGFVVECRND